MKLLWRLTERIYKEGDIMQNKFEDLEPMSKENLYMETAMIIMETY